MITAETRREAEKKVDKQKRYGQITRILKEYPEGLTAKEVAVKMCLREMIPTSERNFAAPWLTEMEKAGRVFVSGKKKCEFTHKTVAVYRLV